MKIKDGFVLTEIGESCVAVATGAAAESFHGVVRLNDTAAFIWRGLSDGLSEEEIAARMLAEYEGIDLEKTKKAVRSIVERLESDGFLEE